MKNKFRANLHVGIFVKCADCGRMLLTTPIVMDSILGKNRDNRKAYYICSDCAKKTNSSEQNAHSLHECANNKYIHGYCDDDAHGA